jgi:nucleoid DNA-binding protein
MDLPQSQTAAVLTQCLPAMMDALQAGESVAVRGFGRFPLCHRPPAHWSEPPHWGNDPASRARRPHLDSGESLAKRYGYS